MTKERPILFSGEMVRAILAGTKTQTRRVVKPEIASRFDAGRGPEDTAAGYPFIEDETGRFWSAATFCPYGAPGDKLWVRETWKPTLEGDKVAYYRATFDQRITRAVGWKPSIFMPRWASRIMLEVISVRVERLQDISEEDAKAEGVDPWADGGYRPAFHLLWNTINLKRGYPWSESPWVWVVEFKCM